MSGKQRYNNPFTQPYDVRLQARWMAETVVSRQSYLLATPLPAEAGSMFEVEAGFLQSQGY
jgi:hypothetical protein